MKCEASGKTCHVTKADAFNHLKNLVRRRGLKVGTVYRCNHCPYFHITKSITNHNYESKRISKRVPKYYQDDGDDSY